MTETTTTADAHYDLMIIGTGSGNSIPGDELADQKIAIVEKGAFGGTCLNVGCIPTKMYVYAADIATAAKEAGTYGVQADFKGVDWPSIVSRVFDKRIDPIAQGGEAYRRGDECSNIDVYDGAGHFVGDKLLRTAQGDTPKTISADRIILAAGARPMIPEVIADSGVTYYTNENILRMEQLPKSMTIMGGGVIAAEFAHIFASFGVDVTIINRSPRLLRVLDQDVSDRYTECASAQFTTALGRTVTSASEGADGVSVTLDNGDTVTSEVLLVALGRTPNGDTLQVEKTGVECVDGTRVKVNEYGETSVDGIWALGDISSPHQLKHVANHEAAVVKHNVVAAITGQGDKQQINHNYVPAGIFTHPQIATVGMTEAEAEEWAADNDTSITVKIQNYGDVAYGWAMEDSTGFAKLIADRRSGLLLGAHYVGPQATTLIQQLITAMVWNIPVPELASKQYWIHPALPELTENALLGLEFDAPDGHATA